MNKLHLPLYNLKTTLLGGQSFSWDFEDGYFYGFTNTHAIKLKQAGDTLYWQTYPEKDDIEFLKSYLRLETNYLMILKRINKDKYIKTAINKFSGLRLVKQDFEQTLLSFLLSAVNNVPGIRKSVRLLSRRLGKKINVDGKEIYLFPTKEAIANAPLDMLLECRIGFRAKYLKLAAQHLLQTGISQKIQNFKENEARKTLKAIYGVGNKIADCVLTYSLGFDNIAPLDRWGWRIATKLYGLNPKAKYDEIRMWFADYFEGYASWAMQFLFEYIRAEK
ncbi:MAG: DNA-3-methyladenine glycosylase family protein [Candidatus Paceibacteria bacterium]